MNSLDEIINRNKDIEIYQDILINDKLYIKGKRSCEDRYKVIKNLISIKKRRFTILDVGANFGYYSFKILKDFPNAFIVMIQPYGEGEILKKICELNTLYNNRIILLDLIGNAKNMDLLSKCEHFDYIICNNVLHHFKDDWLSMYKSFKNMCKYLIIETPPPNDTKSCGQQNLNIIFNTVEKECTKISTEKFIRHTDNKTFSRIYFYKFENKVKLEHPYYDFQNKCPHTQTKRYIDLKSSRELSGSRNYIHIIEDDKRIFLKPYQEVENYRSWEEEKEEYIHGINLYTFLNLNGIFPNKNDIIKKFNKKDILTKYKWDNSLRDLKVWNIIINEHINLIDVIDKNGGNQLSNNDDLNLKESIKYINSFLYPNQPKRP